MPIAKQIEIWLGAFIVLSILSYIFKETRFYRFMNHLLLGVAIGMFAAITWLDVLEPKWLDPIRYSLTTGSPRWGWLWIFAAIPGAMWYTLYSRRYGWLARIVIAVFVGVGAGLAFKNYFLLMLPQITASFKPFVVIGDNGFDWATSLNNLIYVLTLLTVLSYFFFSFRYRSPVLRRSATVGRWMMMICFGTLFGNTVMTRMAYFLDRMNVVMFDWFRDLILIPVRGWFGG